ncbi:hypothetical protein Aperf_G00000065596 [Anoplocephala perfoliata]
MIGVSLLVCSAPAHEDTNGPYQPSPDQQPTLPRQQEKPSLIEIEYALRNMDPYTFKSIILSIPNLKDFLLQFDHHQLMVAFQEVLPIGHMSPQEFKEAIRNTTNINHQLNIIDGPKFKESLLFLCLYYFKNFISYLDKATIQLIMRATTQQPDEPRHPQKSDGQPFPSPHCPPSLQESYQQLPRHTPSPTHSNPSHFDNVTNQEISSTLPQSRPEKDSNIHPSSTDRSSSSILLIFCIFPQLFYVLALYLLR